MFTRHLINHSGAELLAGETVAGSFNNVSHNNVPAAVVFTFSTFPVKYQTSIPAHNSQYNLHNTSFEGICVVDRLAPNSAQRIFFTVYPTTKLVNPTEAEKPE